jgi:hypothetical protein
MRFCNHPMTVLRTRVIGALQRREARARERYAF